MKIGMIGTGNVGSVLGRRWLEAGYAVTFSVRDTVKAPLEALKEKFGKRIAFAPLKDTVEASDVIVLAIPWGETEKVIREAGDLRGKIVVDCINPLAPALEGLSIGTNSSAGEKVAEWAVGAKVVKAFNTTGAGNMADPQYAEGPITMFICGDDPDAKNKVATLAEVLGFGVCDAGGIKAARYLEAVAMLWIHLAFKQGRGSDFGFRLIKRK